MTTWMTAAGFLLSYSEGVGLVSTQTESRSKIKGREKSLRVASGGKPQEAPGGSPHGRGA